jgi:GGDEF domain-containing protein
MRSSLPGSDFNTTAQVAGRLKHNLADCKIIINGKMINFTASYGIHSSVAGSATTVDELLRLADLLPCNRQKPEAATV